ncbi:MAG: DUF362 domain-containing protein, partial [Candidatus Margulisiibacteriota bacterium]
MSNCSTVVGLVKCQNYAPEAVSAAISQAIDFLGGIEKFVKPGQKVLIKPNILNSSPPAKGITTHPEIIRALIRLVLRAGGIPYVGDSPGLGSARKGAEGCGILKVVWEEGAHFIDFHHAAHIGEINFSSGRVLKQVQFVKAVLEMDVVINAAKLKTHGFTGITAAVKNLFGCLPGLLKSQCHVRFARKEDFDLMLLDILQLVKPALNIVDAVVAMEGEGGPVTGALRPMNIIVAGVDAVAVDSVCAVLTGKQPHDFGFL